MTRFKAIAACVAMALGIGVFGSASVLAAPAEPGLLRAADFSESVNEVSGPANETIVNEFVPTGDACTQTIAPDETASGIRRVQFSDPNSAETVLAESVILYPDAKAAKAAYKRHAKTAGDGVKCGSVETSVQGSSGSAVYSSVKVPKIAGGSYSIARGTGEPATDAVAVEFVSGPYVVVLNTFGNASAPSAKELKALARKAAKRLSNGS